MPRFESQDMDIDQTDESTVEILETVLTALQGILKDYDRVLAFTTLMDHLKGSIEVRLTMEKRQK